MLTGASMLAVLELLGWQGGESCPNSDDIIDRSFDAVGMRIESGSYRHDHLRALAQRIEVADREVRIIGSEGNLLQTLAAAPGVLNVEKVPNLDHIARCQVVMLLRSM